MSINISNYIFYYWIFSIIFEAIFLYASWLRIKKSNLFYLVEGFFSVIKNKFDKITIVQALCAFVFVFIFSSPIHLPFSIFNNIKKLFDKLKSENETEPKEKENIEFCKEEGDIIENNDWVKEN